MVKLILCVLACLFAVSYAAVGKTCTTESECDAGECCQILSEFMVVSKRNDLLQAITPTKTGTCQMYKVEGDHCSGFEKMNGYCGCGPGLKCNTYEVPLPTQMATHMLNARSMIAPKPGYQWVSECQKI